MSPFSSCNLDRKLIRTRSQRAQVGKGDAVLVAFDYDAGKSYPIPEETRKYLEARVHDAAKL